MKLTVPARIPVRPTFRRPSGRRAARWGRTLGAAGEFVGTVAGSVPIGLKKRKRASPLPKIVLPMTGGAVAVGLLARRKLSGGGGGGEGEVGAQPSASTGVEGGMQPGATTGGGAEAATPGVTPPIEASAAEVPVDVSAPTMPTDAVDTQTERTRVETVEGPGVEGIVEAPRDAAGETPGSRRAGESSGS